MAESWEQERRKVWGLLLELKRKVKELENTRPGSVGTKQTEEPPAAAGA